MRKKITALLLAAIMLLALTACGTAAQPASTEAPAADTAAESATEAPAEEKALDYPTKNISWIVPVAAGAGVDLVTRQVTDMLDLGVNFSIENITGGQQAIGTKEALSRPADGYTLFSIANAGLLTQPIINPDVGYTVDDIIALAMLTPDVLATVTVNNNSDIKTMEDWVEFVTTKDEFSFAVPNSGGFGHMSCLAVLKGLGANYGKAVAYDGNNGAYQAVLNGEVDFAILDDNVIYNYSNQGTCNVLVALSSTKSPYLPNVEPLSSAYPVDKLDALGGWKIACVSADTPPEIVEFLKTKLDELLLSDEYAKYLEENGYGSFNGKILSIDELSGVINDAVALYSEILVEAGLM